MTRLKVFNKISLSSFKEHDDQYKRKHAVANGYAPSSYKRKPHGYCSDFEEVSNRYITRINHSLCKCCRVFVYNYFDVYISSTKDMELGVLGVVGKLGTRPNFSSDNSFCKLVVKYSKSIGFIMHFKISEERHCLHVSKITTNRSSMNLQGF